MYADLIDILAANGKGIHAYRKCADRARELATGSAERAAAYFLLAALAEDFIDFNERMATTTAQTNAVFDRFSEWAKTLDKASDESDQAAQLAALNGIAAELAKGVH